MNPYITLRALGLATLALVAGAALAQPSVVTTPRGASVAVVADIPIGPGPFPAVVLAPGQAYPMTFPALEETAKALVASGIAVFRFNWAYLTMQPTPGQPSDDLSRELEDMLAVVAYAKGHSRVQANQVSVGGKSLGSIVAWRALAADPTFRSGVLLTPVCSRQARGEPSPRSVAAENYPGLEREIRPVLFVTGSQDPLCSVPILLRFAGNATENIRAAIVGGDHSYENRAFPPAESETARAANLKAVGALAVSFATEVRHGGTRSAP